MVGAFPHPPHTPPLVGREREQAIMRDCLAAALAGHGSLVLIGGEAGIGKTALAEWLCREAEGRGAQVLVGRCYDLTETPPYGPWLELFDAYAAVGDLPPLPTAFAARGLMAGIGSQTALFSEVRDCFAAVATRRPLILVIEDAHWADAASLDLLRALARAAAGWRALLVVTYRSDELSPDQPLYARLPALVREARAARVDLHPISGESVRALVRERYALPDADAARLAAYLQARGEGNPFFIGELLHTLVEERILRACADGWVLGDLGAVRVPPLLQQVIGGRLARLGAEARGLLGIAAVIGQVVPLMLWSIVAGVDETALLPLVARAAAARLLEEMPDGTSVRFVHALTREAVYEGVSPLRRRALHLRAGEALMETPDADPDAVAYHFRQAGDPRAMLWLYRAATRAAWFFAVTTALDRIEATSALLAAQPTGTGPFPSADENRALAAHLRFTRGQVRCQQGALRRGLADMEEAIAALDTLSLPDDASLTRLLHRWGISLDRRNELIQWLAPTGHYTRAQALAERLLAQGPDPAGERARESGTYAHSNIYYALGMIHAARGRPDAARQAYVTGVAAARAQQAMNRVAIITLQELTWVAVPYDTENDAEQDRLAREAEAAFSRPHDEPPGILPRFAHLSVLALRGLWEEARAVTEAMLALDLGGSYRHIPIRAFAPVALAQGDVVVIERLVREELPEGPETAPGNGIFPTGLLLQRLAAALALDRGDATSARAWLEAHDRWLAWNGTVLGQSEGASGWAAYFRAMGDPERAYVHAQRALAHATEPRQPLALIAAHRLLGELDAEAGRFDASRQHLDSALALADACAAPYERALTLLALAGLHATTGKPADATALLMETRAICASLGARPALVRADALAARLGAARSSYPDGLTAREVDVLRLIAAGRSNREITDTLAISERTVNRHITNLYGKIGARGKADATAYALRHGLA
jgi:DNA-binding CsgD family transcriptional regulator